MRGSDVVLDSRGTFSGHGRLSQRKPTEIHTCVTKELGGDVDVEVNCAAGMHGSNTVPSCCAVESGVIVERETSKSKSKAK